MIDHITIKPLKHYLIQMGLEGEDWFMHSRTVSGPVVEKTRILGVNYYVITEDRVPLLLGLSWMVYSGVCQSVADGDSDDIHSS